MWRGVETSISQTVMYSPAEAFAAITHDTDTNRATLRLQKSCHQGLSMIFISLNTCGVFGDNHMVWYILPR